MTLSLHKLWAGSGYEYLTRQVARLDATHPGGSSLASYYAERGETPGCWVGSGLAGVEGLAAGDVVTAEQMRALFGRGLHPLAGARVAAAEASGASSADAARAGRLGAPFRPRTTGPNLFEAEVRQRLIARAPPADPGGVEGSAAEVAAVRAEVVSEIAAGWFERRHGRLPADGRELAGAVARWSGGPGQPVAGFDLTFSPVKSVSALWALAPPAVAAEMERAHRAAVEDALRFVEQRALFTREGARGVRQVEVTGLVAAAFTHRDSRAGDPDLHTHVAVANKVQTRQGKWLAIDGRVLYAATVAASETYNTALERHLGERLGLTFAPRPPDHTDHTTQPGSPDHIPRHDVVGQRAPRPVREVVGVDLRLLEGWSTRRTDIDVARTGLARDFQERTGRPPTRSEAWALAQQATLATRPAKHEPRTLAEQRTAWAAQAARLLGSRAAVEAMVDRALHPRHDVAPAADAAWVARAAERVIGVLEAERATWGLWHLHAEAQRQVRTLDLPPGMVEHVVDLLVGETVARCVPLTLDTTALPELPPLSGLPEQPGPIQESQGGRPAEEVAAPRVLQRADGTTIYEVVGSRRWTSTRILHAEQAVLDTASRTDGRRVDPATVNVALTEAAVHGPGLNAGQAALVRDLAGSGARVQVALAPAGTGKTTALRVLTAAWTAAGGTAVGLAPSAAAAAVLAEQLDAPADTLAKLVWHLDHPTPAGSPPPTWVAGLGPGSLVVVDEAGLADTPSVARAIEHVVKLGGSVRLVGDDQQLGAVGAGGLLRDLAHRHGAARLDDVVRFTDPAEAAASLALRDGRVEALGFYLDRQRVHVGDPTTTADQLFDAWTTDRARGLDSLMLAPTRTLVAQLNARARTARLTPTTAPADAPALTRPSQQPSSASTTAPMSRAPEREVTLADKNQASAGDTVITRTNDRRLTATTTANEVGQGPSRSTRARWVRNGDRWVVEHVHPDGRLTVVSLRDSRRVVLPADYVRASVELGYASTIHAAQGSTCDTVHGSLTGRETRAQLYTLLTRGRTANHAYLQFDPDTNAAAEGGAGAHDLGRPDATPLRTATEVLEQILGRDSDDTSATTHLQDLHDPARRLPAEIDRYLDSLHAAADDTTPTHVVGALTATAERLLPGLTDEPAWPTLRSHLLLDALQHPHPQTGQHHNGQTGQDPAQRLTLAVALHGLDDPDHQAHDRAAVLHHRLTSRQTPPEGGPLPWLPAIPDPLLNHPAWGHYLRARAALLDELATTIRTTTAQEQLAWTAAWNGAVDSSTVGDTAVWRAGHRVPAHDLNPLGPPPSNPAARSWYAHLQNATTSTAPRRDDTLAEALLPAPTATQSDPYRGQLILHLARLADLEPTLDVQGKLRKAVEEGPLPDDHPSAALWWRLHRHLSPTTLRNATHAEARASATTETREPAAGRSATENEAAPTPPTEVTKPAAALAPTTAADRVDVALLVAGMLRLGRPVTAPPALLLPDQSRRQLIHVNELTLRYYRDRYPRSWAAAYLAERCGTDLADDPRFHPGHAPAGWTRLVDHLRRHCITDQDMLDAGVAHLSSRGHLIDLFRDRLVLPIWNTDHDLVGFIARRRDTPPDGHVQVPHEEPAGREGPKYLNTPTTALYSKRQHLYGEHLLGLTATDAALTADTSALVGDSDAQVQRRVPVLVEGPLDAVAVTLASPEHIGLANLGTALTDQQAAVLARHHTDPVVALDADPAGAAATRRAFWTLTAAKLDPHLATLTPGTDPAALYQHGGAQAVRQTLLQTEPLADHLHRHLTADRATAAQPHLVDEQLRVAAARPPATWPRSIETLADQHGLDPDRLRERLLHLLTETPTFADRAAQPPPPRQQTATPQPAAPGTPSTRGRQQPPADEPQARSQTPAAARGVDW